MTVVQNTVKDAAGELVKDAKVLIRLVGAPAFDTTTSSEIVTVGTVTTDTDGQWSKDLTPVSHYGVAGCYYTANEPGGVIRSFTVPDTGGPYWLNDVLKVAPSAPEASLGVVRYDADQTTALTSAQQAQARANIGAGTGGGAVASVNGQTGAVVLGAADVGADAAGAAATAQAAAIAASQPLDSDLTAIAALTTTVYGRSLLTAADAAALRTAAALGTAATANTGDFDASGAAAAAQSAAISAAATDATTKANAAQAAAIAASQPLDSDLTAIAALTTTSFGRSFLALADAAAARALLALGGAATLNVGTTTGTVAAGDDSRITGAVPKSTVTAKGDLIVATGSGAVTNLAVGADGTVPVADSAQAGGVAWTSAKAETRGMKSGRMYYPQHFGTLGSGSFTTLTIGRLYACGILRPRAAVTLDRWAYFVDSVAGTAGTIMRAGLWLIGDDGMPGALAFDLGSSAADVINTEYQVTCSPALKAGVEYVLGVVPQVGTTGPKLKVADRPTSDWGTEAANANQLFRYANPFSLASDGVTGALGSWPTTYVTGNTSGLMPLVGVRAA